MRTNNPSLNALLMAAIFAALTACESIAPTSQALSSVREEPCPEAKQSPGVACVVIESKHTRPLDRATVVIKGELADSRRKVQVVTVIEDRKIQKMAVSTGMGRWYVVQPETFAKVEGVYPGSISVNYLRGDEGDELAELGIGVRYGEPQSRADLGCDATYVEDPAYATLWLTFDPETHSFTRMFHDACGNDLIQPN